MPEFQPKPVRHRNPLHQLTANRVAKLLGRLGERLHASVTPLATHAGQVVRNDAPVTPAEALAMTYAPFAPGSFFGPPGGGWAHRWFRLDVPRADAGTSGRRHLLWQCQGESTAYIERADGLVPWAGLDNVHATCPLPDEACRLYLAAGCWQTGIWGPKRLIEREGLRFDGANLVVRDEQAWQAFHDLDVLVDLINTLGSRDGAGGAGGSFGHRTSLTDATPALRRALFQADMACDAFATGGVEALLRATADAFAALRGGGEAGTAGIYGHAHIDMVWMWPEWVADEKSVHSFATVCRLLERYPEALFLQSMPAIYRRLAETTPDTLRQIEEARHRGQWEVTGAFEVEPDVNLPCGEALARGIEVGQRLAATLNGGEATRVCWLPDVFGYPRCLPQVLAMSGVGRFYTTKMHWSAVTRFPYSAFVWRGPDGESEVLSFISPVGYNGACDLAEHERALRHNRQAGVLDESLIGTGYGDGGGAMTERMCERARRQADLAGVPRTRWTTAGDFFDRLERVRRDLPHYEGELYLEYHRGTYTTQSEHKRLYRRLEAALCVHEAARAARGLGPLDDAGHDARWRRLLFAQFHDALPGSSIAVVYRQLNPELEALGTRELADAAATLGAGEVHAFNASPVPRVLRVDGRAVATRGLSSSGTEVTGLEATEAVLRSDHVQAAFDADGRLSHLTIQGERLPIDTFTLRLYRDDPANYDAWDIDHEALTFGHTLDHGPLHVIEQTAGVATLASRPVTLPEDMGQVTVRYTLVAGERHLRVTVEADWRAEHRLLKFHAQTGLRGRFARFGGPFGATSRPQVSGTEADEAMWEVPGSRWAAVTDDQDAGVAFVTEAKYGFSCRDGDLGVSLLRSPQYPDAERGGSTSAGEGVAGEGGGDVAEQGRHVMHLAVGRYEPVWRGEVPCTAADADALFLPVVRHGGEVVKPPFDLFDLGGLVPSWVRPAASGWLLRLHETAGACGRFTLRVNTPASCDRLAVVDLAGKVLREVPPTDGTSFSVDYGSYAILGVRPC